MKSFCVAGTASLGSDRSSSFPAIGSGWGRGLGRWLVVWIWASLGLAHGASWYLDNAASGLKTGLSWKDAWPNATNINWTAIQPGDTLYISGGFGGKKYAHGLTIGKSGTPQAPITIRVGRERAHNGPVMMKGISFGAQRWVTVNGALDDNFQAPTDVSQVRSMVSNIGIRIADTDGSSIFMTSPMGIKIQWVSTRNSRRGTYQEAHGIAANMTSGGDTDFNEIRYCWISHTDDDGINWIGNNPATHFKHQEVAFSIIEFVGDDGIEGNHGFDVHDCIIGPARSLRGHPDGIQSLGSYWRIYNNQFHDYLNSFLRLQASQPLTRDILVFNNLFYSGRYGAADGVVDLKNQGIEIAQYAAYLGEIPLMVWTNVVVANNTMVVVGNPEMSGDALWMGKRDQTTADAFVHNLVLTNCMYVNNVLEGVHSGGGVGWQPWKTESPWGTGPTYARPEDVVCDYNTHSGSVSFGSQRFHFYGTSYATGEEMALSSPWKHNTSSTPRYQSRYAWNFSPATNDTVILNTGTNLSWMFDFDVLNRPRTSSGPWTRGAFGGPASNVEAMAVAQSGMLLQLGFEDSLDDERIDDSSGAGNHAYRFGRPGSLYPTNFPVIVPVSSTPGRRISTGNAGEFTWFLDGWGIYGRSGTYGAITNFSPFVNMSQMTVALWARYYPAPFGMDYSTDANATLVSAGTSTGILGSWDFGRFNQKIWQNNTRFCIMTNQATFERAIIEFPDRGYDNRGDTTNWHHYAVSFNNGVYSAYFDGALLTNSVTFVSALTLAWNNNVSMPFLGIGCDTHGGSPALEDEPGGPDYPNNGWFNGVMDDVRIYNRALTGSEISAIFGGRANGLVGYAAGPPAQPQGVSVKRATP